MSWKMHFLLTNFKASNNRAFFYKNRERSERFLIFLKFNLCAKFHIFSKFEFSARIFLEFALEFGRLLGTQDFITQFFPLISWQKENVSCATKNGSFVKPWQRWFLWRMQFFHPFLPSSKNHSLHCISRLICSYLVLCLSWKSTEKK